jgi:hypothetical protein
MTLEEQEAMSADMGTSESTQETENLDATSEVGTSDEEASSADEGTSKSEEWFEPGRFRTAQDALNSYKQLESAYGRTQSELHNLRRQQQQAQSRISPEEEVEQFAQKVKKNPVEAIREIARNETQQARYENQQLRFETEYKQRMQNSEFAELEPVMTQLATAYAPLIKVNGMENDPALLDILYLAAKGAKQQEKLQEATASAKKKGEAAAIKKTKAQVEGGTGSRGKTVKNIKNMSSEELRIEIEKGNL